MKEIDKKIELLKAVRILINECDYRIDYLMVKDDDGNMKVMEGYENEKEAWETLQKQLVKMAGC